MHIISFATKESNWSTPRVGFLLHAGDRDTGYRLDCEKLFDKEERPANPLAWFDMDGRWVPRGRRTHDAPVRDPDALDKARERGWLVPRQDAYWFAPVPRPGKLICIGLNYRDHPAERKIPIPEKPVVFSKFASAVIGPGEPVVLPSTSNQVDYEAELAVVVLTENNTRSLPQQTMTCGVLMLVLSVTLTLMLLSERFMALIGRAGASV